MQSAQATESPGQQFRARVHVFPRAEILDPQGKAIGDALGRLGFGDIGEVRAGKEFRMEVQAADEASARARIEEMCEKLLANTVTEDYTVELLSGAER